MLTKTQLEKYADVLMWGLKRARQKAGGRYKKGDIIRVGYDIGALDLTEVFYRKLLEWGMIPVMDPFPTPKMESDLYRVGKSHQLKFVGKWREELYKKLNGVVALWAPASLDHLAGADPKKIAMERLAKKSFHEIMQKREAMGQLGWTLCMIPTRALAEKAGMTVEEYTQEIVKACFLDKKDPVKTWDDAQEKIKEAKRFLDGVGAATLHIESKNINLVVPVGEKRQWLGGSGHNIPSFEIFTTPDWRGVEGVYFANMPSFQSGNLVDGVRLVFKKGRITEASAIRGEKFVKTAIVMDKGAAQVGEISLTDKKLSPIRKFMANTLFDENVGGENGNFHLAVGFSYSDAFSGDQKKLTKQTKKRLGFNASALHWDLVNTEEKVVTARLKSGKEKIIYEKGEFKI